MSARALAPAASPAADAPSRVARDQARAGLYVHVPFCAVRCHYCDFATGALSAAMVERWVAALERECARRAPEVADVTFHSVFFGGGTPSTLSARHFRRVRDALATQFALAPGAEITLEANPESVRAPLLEAWAAAGVNRLSMGVQSFVPAELARLGRIHDAERPRAAFALARAHGFANLSLDLMFAFPDHTLETWSHTLERALALEPAHLSAYCYIPEPGTPMGDAVAAGELALPAPGAQADAYAMLGARLAAHGYACYETSNFCRPEREARHNLVYWLRRPYLGLGPSAASFIADRRWTNHRGTSAWAAALEQGRDPAAERETPSAEAADEERMMLALRLGSGLEDRDHDAPAWRALLARYGIALASAVGAGRLERHAHGWRIPAAHRFLADDTIAWIAARGARVSSANAAADTATAVDTSFAPLIPSLACPSPHSQATPAPRTSATG
ncbi:MAG TPA: radical SAM family heme chaperone HemW [Candidatus Eisenbacteria bacterium]|nr:radical SAM family heme chaperone HemW [Candidatus Eisenbacteria bacterium]